MRNIRLQAPTLARKCEISHQLPCDAYGWVDQQMDVHVQSHITTCTKIPQITTFS